MRCLYCGKELALLKRLTGGGEFCSEAHKQSYQEEYNRLALSRLLQAQKKGQASAAAQNVAPRAAAVAVEESAPEPQPEVPATSAVEQSSAETLAAETTLETAPAPIEPAPPVAGFEPPASAEVEPTQLAGFLTELPAVAASSTEPQPYQQPQVELAPSPTLSEWQAENPSSFELSQANLQALDWALNAPSIGDRAPSADLLAQTWPSAQPNPIVSSPHVSSSADVSSSAARNRTAANQLGSSAVIAVQITPVSGEPASDQTFVHPVPFEGEILFSESEFLELAPTSITFPAEDADVAVLERRRPEHRESEHIVPEHGDLAGPDVPIEDTTPSSSLEALSRLHQEMIEQQAEQAAPADPEEGAAPVENVAAAPEVVAPPPQDSPGQEPAAGPVTIDIVADAPEQAEQESRPAYSTDILDISLRIFPPSKGTPRAGELLPSPTAPLLPHLKALPLRPKVALARGYVPGAPAGTESPATAAVPSRKPAPRPQAKPSAPAVKTAPPLAAKPAAAKEAAKAAAVPAPTPQPTPVAKVEAPPIEKAAPAPPEAPVPEVRAPDVKKNEPVSKPAESANPAAQTKPEQAKPEPRKPETSQPEPAKSESPQSQPVRPQPVRPEPARSQPARSQSARSQSARSESVKEEDVPHFGIGQPANVAWYGSLKVKLGIAIVLLLIACIYFLGWGSGKSHPPASANAAPGDGSGPSIILGEGGWVEGWGGDPSGLHVGRQITIYRPSLKLSDYRIEFQASIDLKSIGWVFRAADPENYYAMKIATVSTTLPLKVALFKYLVANGKQIQVGRVPIDLPVQPDTVFNVREDVRGPHFTTYIQGQQIDSWTDDQLKVGGVGLLNEREERGKVSSVSIRYLTGGK